MFLFPGGDLLSSWISIISSNNVKRPNHIAQYLPVIDDKWVSRMMNIFERLEYKCSISDNFMTLCLTIAELFYNIIKIHQEIDGNKRSALICTYFFILLNTSNSRYSYIFSKEALFKVSQMSVRIAKSKGSQYEKVHKSRLSKEFCNLLGLENK